MFNGTEFAKNIIYMYMYVSIYLQNEYMYILYNDLAYSGNN